MFVLKILKVLKLKKKEKNKNCAYNSILPYHAPHPSQVDVLLSQFEVFRLNDLESLLEKKYIKVKLIYI